MPSIAEVRAKFPQYNDMTDEELVTALHGKFYADMPVDEFKAKVGYKDVPTRYGDAANAGKSFTETWMDNYGKQALAKRDGAAAAQSDLAKQYKGNRFTAATEGSHAGLLGGYDDELTAAATAPFDAAVDWYKGKGFDLVDAYTRKQKALADQKSARRAAYPGASLTGETLGGMALGGTAAKNGLTLNGKNVPGGPLAGAMLEGAGYGALYGSGEARPGERLKGAVLGGLTGATTGAAVQTTGQVLAKLGAQSSQPGPTSRELKAQSQDMFDVGETSGVELRPEASGKLRERMTLAAGKVGRRQPETANFLADLEDTFNGATTLEDFETFRQDLGAAIRKADPKDARSLLAMKRVMDDVTDSPSAADWFHPDDRYGVEAVSKARDLWAKSKKTEIVEKILDLADVKGNGTYTQSGMANAIKNQMGALYKQIVDGKVRGFSEAEVQLIRNMAMGGDASRLTRLLSTFAPRGPVSIAAGQLLGGIIPGGQYALPVAGQVAAMARDQAAVNSANALRNSVATGIPPISPALLPNKAWPFIGGATSAAEYGRRQLLGVQ